MSSRRRCTSVFSTGHGTGDRQHLGRQPKSGQSATSMEGARDDRYHSDQPQSPRRGKYTKVQRHCGAVAQGSKSSRLRGSKARGRRGAVAHRRMGAVAHRRKAQRVVGSKVQTREGAGAQWRSDAAAQRRRDAKRRGVWPLPRGVGQCQEKWTAE